jgi:hypothetical protein
MKGKRNPIAKAVRQLRPLAGETKRWDVPRKHKDKGRSDGALRLSA